MWGTGKTVQMGTLHAISPETSLQHGCLQDHSTVRVHLLRYKTHPDLSLGMGSHFCKSSERQVMHVREALTSSATHNPFYFSVSLSVLDQAHPLNLRELSESGGNCRAVLAQAHKSSEPDTEL